MDIKIKILRHIATKSLQLYNKNIIPKSIDKIVNNVCCRLCNYILDKEYKKKKEGVKV